MTTHEQTFKKPTSTPTPVRPEVKALIINYINDPSRQIPANLNVLVELLFCEQHDIEEKPDLRHTGLLSEEAATWAGFSRRDPYVDVPKYPPTSFLNEVRHTFSSIVLMIRDAGSKSGRKELAGIIEALPEIPA